MAIARSVVVNIMENDKEKKKKVVEDSSLAKRVKMSASGRKSIKEMNYDFVT